MSQNVQGEDGETGRKRFLVLFDTKSLFKEFSRFSSELFLLLLTSILTKITNFTNVMNFYALNVGFISYCLCYVFFIAFLPASIII